MIDASQVWQFLEDHADELALSNRELLQERDRLRKSAQAARRRTAADLQAALDFPTGRHGAYPSSEWTTGMGDWLPFETGLPPNASRREWSRWAERASDGVTTLAVDGSQIYPSGDWSVPIAAVRVGMFENPHRGKGDYRKSTSLKPLLPYDLLASAPDDAALQDAVNERRHRLEIQTLIDWMESRAGEPGRRIAIFDGSLVVSFATSLRPGYVESVLDLMEASEKTQTPVVGYVDSSRARDLSQMYSWLDSGSTTDLNDGVLLPQSEWLQRTPAFVCARAKGLENYERRGRQSDVHFVYLRSSRDALPARLEFPGWILESGRLEQVVDSIRAEIVAQGGGYPYAMETADAVAVLTSRDRDRFRDIFRRFTERHFSASSPLRSRRSRPKSESKQGRR
ncbi:MAG: DNA double-strand break repair nuclease NurA [Chloroflexi bacterium]|nr:DNA double-strand break repair nuclease NurA [Chloroflexota bacterium]